MKISSPELINLARNASLNVVFCRELKMVLLPIITHLSPIASATYKLERCTSQCYILGGKNTSSIIHRKVWKVFLRMPLLVDIWWNE